MEETGIFLLLCFFLSMQCIAAVNSQWTTYRSTQLSALGPGGERGQLIPDPSVPGAFIYISSLSSPISVSRVELDPGGTNFTVTSIVIQGTPPRERYGWAGGLVENRYAVIAAGRNNIRFDDVFAIDTGSMSWITLPNLTTAVSTTTGATGNVGTGKSVMFMFGGFTDLGSSDLLFKWTSPSSRSEFSDPSIAPARFGATLIAPTGNQYELLICGGYYNLSFLFVPFDVVGFDGSSFSVVSTTAAKNVPAPRSGGIGTWIPAASNGGSKDLLFFGAGQLDTFYLLDLDSAEEWTSVNMTGTFEGNQYPFFGLVDGTSSMVHFGGSDRRYVFNPVIPTTTSALGTTTVAATTTNVTTTTTSTATSTAATTSSTTTATTTGTSTAATTSSTTTATTTGETTLSLATTGQSASSTQGTAPAKASEDESSEAGFPLWIILVIAGGAILCCCIVIVIVVVKNRKKSGDEEEEGEEKKAEPKAIPATLPAEDDEEEEVIYGDLNQLGMLSEEEEEEGQVIYADLTQFASST